MKLTIQKEAIVIYFKVQGDTKKLELLKNPTKIESKKKKIIDRN